MVVVGEGLKVVVVVVVEMIGVVVCLIAVIESLCWFFVEFFLFCRTFLHCVVRIFASLHCDWCQQVSFVIALLVVRRDCK